MSKIEYIDSDNNVVETVEVADVDAMMDRARTRAEMLGLTARKYREPEPEPTEAEQIENARAEAYTRIKQAHSDALSEARERYSETEREGWSELITDAKAGEGSVIEGYAAELGISVAEAASRILAVREGYRQAYGQATGKLTRLRDAVDAAETVEELEAITW